MEDSNFIFAVIVEELQLKVEKGYPIDFGRGIVRLDPAVSLKLNLGPGDIVEIKGQKKTAAKVWKADRQDWEKGLVRVDTFTQQNAGTSIGETVFIKKIEVPIAKKLVLTLPENITKELPEFQILQKVSELIKSLILKRPVYRGDIIPIINSVPQLMTESLNTSQVFTLVVDETEPSNNIVQVSEETIISLHVNKELNSSINNKIDHSSSNWNQFLESIFKSSRNDDEIDLRILSEAIVKTKDNYEKISDNVKKYNADYVVEDSIILTNLDDFINKSDKIIYEYMYNLKLQDAFNYVNELDSKLELYHKAALSEITRWKIKEIEFQINDPFFVSKLRKRYKRLVSEFDKLDAAGIQGTKNGKEFVETLEKLMEKLQEIEDELEEEQKTGVRSTFKTAVLWLIPVLLSFYSLVADDYLKVNFYTPIAFCILLSVLMYLFLKSGVNLKIIYTAYKNNLIRLNSINFIFFILLPILMIYSSYGALDIISEGYMSISSGYFFFLIFCCMLSLITTIGVFPHLRRVVKELKLELIKEEVDNLIKKYGFDIKIRP